MSEQTATHTMSFEEFTANYVGKRYEYVDGRAVPMGPEIAGPEGEFTVAPTKGSHGLMALELGRVIANYVTEHKLGKTFGAETGILLENDPPLIRAADVSFISNQRLEGIILADWIPVPDLVVEVVSEYDLAKEIRAKTLQYLAAGVRQVWIVYPDNRFIDIYEPQRDAVTVQDDDTLTGGEVLPNFSFTVSHLFEVLDD